MKGDGQAAEELRQELAAARRRTAELEAANKKRWETEAALRESEARYRALVENSLTAISIQQHGKLVFVNQRFAEIFGYAQEELIGKPIWEIVARGA